MKTPSLKPTHAQLCRGGGPHLRLRRVKRLRSDCGVELCVIVEVILDNQIALARGLGEPRDVENANFFAGVFDKSLSLENSGGRRNSGTATPKHVSEKLMRNLERVGVGALPTDEQPAGESLFEVVFCIASSGLHCQKELCLNIAQSQRMKVAAKVELSSRVLNAAGVAMAGNLGIDAIQTLFCSHKS